MSILVNIAQLPYEEPFVNAALQSDLSGLKDTGLELKRFARSPAAT